jgi:hypothetical protein
MKTGLVTIAAESISVLILTYVKCTMHGVDVHDEVVCVQHGCVLHVCAQRRRVRRKLDTLFTAHLGKQRHFSLILCCCRLKMAPEC